MAKLSVGMFELGHQVEVDFSEFISLIKGMSIKSAADWGEGRFEIGLSGGLMLRIFQSENGLSMNIVSTINKEEISPLILTLPSETEFPSVKDLQDRLFGLRQLYSIIYLLSQNDSRLSQLVDEIDSNQDIDIENLYLEEDEKLRIESFAPGSWITTIWTKSKEAKSALTLMAGLVYKEGRENMIRRVRAETRIKEIEADENEFNLYSKKIDYINKIAQSNPKLKKTVELEVEKALLKLLDGPNQSVKVVEIKSELTEGINPLD